MASKNEDKAGFMDLFLYSPYAVDKDHQYMRHKILQGTAFHVACASLLNSAEKSDLCTKLKK